MCIVVEKEQEASHGSPGSGSRAAVGRVSCCAAQQASDRGYRAPHFKLQMFRGGQRLAHVGPQRVAVGLRSGLSGAQRSRPATVGTRHRAPYFQFQAFRAHLWGALPLTISGTSQNTRPCRLTICMTARLATTIQTPLF